MIKPTLIVMAAGIGSRYGGLKQIDPVGPSREIIMDYSVYDAIKAGFGRVVFIIKEEIKDLFMEKTGNRIASTIPVDYVCQRLDDLPKGFFPPTARVKPWGTSHAVYCCRDIIHEPFVVINADDFYGADAFEKVVDFLRKPPADTNHQVCMVGYDIENTLTEHGFVTRGVSVISDGGYLESIAERKKIRRIGGQIIDTDDAGDTIIAPGTVVSMNFWGFFPSIMQEFERYLSLCLTENSDNLESVEFYLPLLVNELIKEEKVSVKVFKTGAKWYGVTYQEDREAVQKALRDMIKSGIYPEKLWPDE